MALGQVIPILRIFDERKAREFYISFLGFSVNWEHRFEEGLPLYMQVSRDGCVLHLSEHHGDGSPGAKLRIETTDVHALHGELFSKRYPYGHPELEETPWETRELKVHDPFGNQLTFAMSVTK